jgi:hypothetical protein
MTDTITRGVMPFFLCAAPWRRNVSAQEIRLLQHVKAKAAHQICAQ